MHCRYLQWCERELPRAVLADLANELRDRDELDESKCFIDTTVASAKDGVAEIAAACRCR